MVDEWKPEMVSPNALIKLGTATRNPTSYKSFSQLSDASQLSSLTIGAPAWHENVMSTLKAAGKIREDPIVAQAQRSNQSSFYRPQQQKMRFTQGAIVKNKAGKKLTIIRAAAGHTKKTMTPVHKVADKNGNVWLEKETDLLLIL